MPRAGLRRARKQVHIGLSVGLAVLLGVSVAQNGTTTVQLHPRPVALETPADDRPVPQQRWDDAAGLNPVADGPRNTYRPESTRARYPVLKAPKAPANVAAMVTPPRRAPGEFRAASSQELPAERSAHERTWANADGTRTTEFSASALNYRRGDGSWAPIDSTLAADPAGGWRRTADSVGLHLAARADAAELVRVTLPGGGTLAYGAADAAPVTGTVTGDTATYRGVWPQTDVELQAQAGGVKETLVLGSAAAPRSFVFPLRLTGLTAALKNGEVLLRNGEGAPVATIPAGFLADAKEQVSDAVAYELIQHEGGPALRMTASDAWLDEPGRAYPVRLDPPVLANGAATESLVVQGGSSHGGGDLAVGRRNGVSSASYVKFPGLVSRLDHETIFSAQLSFAAYDAPSCKPRQLSVHPVTGSWSSSTDTSYPGPAVGAALASSSFAQGYVGLGESASKCPVTGTVLDLGAKGRDLVQGWVNGKANNGISFRAPVGDESSWKTIAGTGSANPPKLYVTHTPYNAKYSIPSPTPKPAVLQNQAGKVKVTVTNTSAMDWTPSGFKLVYRLYNAKTSAKIGQYVAGSLGSTLARGATTSIEATIKALPIGDYLLDFSMATTGGKVFTDEAVPPARIALSVQNIAPVVGDLYPPNGYQAPILTPQLWAQAVDLDAPPKQTLQYKFEYCGITAAGAPTGCTTTAYQAKQAYTIPAAKLKWSTSYVWRAFVKDNATEVSTAYATLVTAVPQPELTSRVANAPYGTTDREFDPDIGNYSTAAIDATVATAGPALTVARTYNSLDTRRDLAFGEGWMTQADMRVAVDGDGSGNVLVTYPDGQQVRFGKNSDGTFAAPAGRTAQLTVANGLYSLRDAKNTVYTFRGGDGRINTITDKYSRVLAFTYTDTGRLAKMQAKANPNATTGRALTFGWNSTNTHITSVSTEAVAGRVLTWTYEYTGDSLTKVCGPGAEACTTYAYTPGSQYRGSVLDSDPDSYWRLGEKNGATAAGSEVIANLGKDAATLRNVTLEQPGAVAGSAATGAGFNGSSAVAELPKGIVKRGRDTAVELWFKVSKVQTGGPLIGYQDTAIDGTPATGVPLLYVGTDGHVYGQFKTAATAPKPLDGGVDVRDDKWHYVALSVTGDVQTLYVDGVKKTKPASEGVLDHSLLTFNQAGAAYATSPATWPAWGSTAKRYFHGSLDEIAVYGHALSDQTVAAHRGAGGTAANQLAAVTLPSGKTASETTYDTSTGRVEQYTDGNGGTWKIGNPTVYGGDTDLRRSVQVLDPADRGYLYEYDALAGRLLRSGSPMGVATRPEDKPLPSAEPSPSPTEICSSPDPGEPQFCTTIPGDATGPIFTEHELTGMVVRSFGYDAQGRQNKIVSETGDQVTMTFDARGNVASRTSCRAAGSCQTTYTAYTTPDSANPFHPLNDLPVEVRDPRSASATDAKYKSATSYNSVGDIALETTPLGATTKTEYTTGSELGYGSSTASVPAGLVAAVTDAAGKVTRFKYTAAGDLALTTTPSGLVTESTYDAIGRKIQDKETSDSFPAGVVTTYAYDDFGRPITTTGPVTTNAVDQTKHQAVTTRTYDLDGNIVRTVVKDAQQASEPERVTTIEYDEFNHQTRTVSPEGDEQTEGWDRFGNRVSVVDGNGNRYGYAYTARNALAEVRLYDWRDGGGGAGQDYVVLNSYAYDWAGRMAVQIDSMGRRIEFTYFGDDMIAKKVLKNFHDPDGTTRDLVMEDNTYDAAGNLTRQVLANGTDVSTNTFDELGRPLTTTQDPGGVNRSSTQAYDPLGNVVKTTVTGTPSNVPWLTSSASRVLTTVYNAKGQIFQEKVSDGTRTQTTSYTYDQRGLVLTTTDPNTNVTTFRYDENGDRTATVAPAVSTETGGGPAQVTSPAVTTGYNAFGEVVATRDALGTVSRTKYDRMGRAVESTGPLYTPAGSADTAASPVTKVEYDALNNVVASTDARGHVSRFTYDRLNRLTEKDLPGSSDAQRLVWKYTYTRTGKLLSSTSPTGIRTESTYDDLDRQITTTRFERKPVARTLVSAMTYDDAGNVVSVRSPGGLVTSMTYNKVGEVLTTTDPATNVARLGYDAFGNTVRQSDGAGRTTRRDYDVFGQVTAEADLAPDGTEVRRSTYGYDLNGNVTSRTSALKKTVTFEYDAHDRMVKQVEPKGSGATITTSFGYDAAGNRTRYTDGRGLSTFYTVNALGLPETVVEPSTAAHPALADRTWTVGYDLGGNPTRLTAPGGVVRTRTYDAAGRITTETGSGAGTAARGLTYDLESRTTVVTSGGANANTFSYDDRGNLLAATGVSGDSSFGYDDDGNLVSRTDVTGTATFGYKAGRMDTIKDSASGITQTMRYNSAGLVDRIDYGAGRLREYGYDTLGRLATDALKNASGGVASSITYKYDLDDHLTGKDTTGTAGAGSNTYGYDDAGRLTSWTSGAGKVEYGWDDSGNRIRAGAKTAEYDERNRLIRDSDYTYAYTPRGTLAGRTSSGLTETYSFDAFDRLVSAEGATYVYDGLDRVLNRNGQLLTYAGTEQDTVSDGKEQFARGPDGSLLAVSTETDGAKMVISDQHDDVVGGFAAGSALTSLDSSTAYDPYGQKVASSGTQSAAGFQGDWTDPDTGQVDMGARFYDPGTGTFTSRDTVAYTSGDSILANKYTYGAGDPMSNNDPTGNWPSCGWCKRAVSAVVTPIVQAATTVYHAAQTVYHAAVSAGTWLVNQAKAAVSAIGRGIVTVVRNAGAALRSAGQALRSGYNRYIAPTVNSVRNYAAQKAAQIRAAAIAVKDHAKATIAKAVAHVPLKQLGAAVKAGLKSTLSKITISVNAALPSITASFSNVVQDYAAAAKSLYAGAVAAGSAVVSGVQAAGDWVVDHKAEIIGGIAGAVVGVGCGALIGVTGVGAVACAAAGGAVGSLVTDLVEGGKGWKEMAADAVLGGTIGAVMGPLSSIGGSAVSGAVRGLISGGAREALSMGGAAAASSLRSFGSRQVGGVVGKALANRSAGSAAREAVESTGAGVRSSVRVDAGDTCNSFAVGTAVLMADGTSKAIEQVKVGDMVLATDPTTGKSEPRKVTALVVGVGTKRMVDLTVDVDGARGDRTATLSATDGHPFWAPDLQRWVTAGELRAGSLLQTGTGTYVQVTATRSWTATTKEVRNLTVDVAHTYYVVAGGTRILVHNCASADLLGYAETLRPNAGKKGIMFAAKYTSPSGRSYFGYNGHDVMPKPGGVMETAVEQLGKPGHQYCAETMCLMLAEKAEGDAAFGGVMEVIKVRGLQSPPGGAHGTPASPCSESCRPRLADLEIDHIMGQR